LERGENAMNPCEPNTVSEGFVEILRLWMAFDNPMQAIFMYYFGGHWKFQSKAHKNQGGKMDPSTYSLEIKEEAQHLCVRAHGIRTPENVAKIASQVFQKTLEAGKTGLLMDVREFSGRLGVSEDYYLVTDVFAQFRGKWIRRVAIVDVEESPVHE
jgi:hypothetical protein